MCSFSRFSSKVSFEHVGCIISCGIMTAQTKMRKWPMSQSQWNFIGELQSAAVPLLVWTSADCNCGHFCRSHNALWRGSPAQPADVNVHRAVHIHILLFFKHFTCNKILVFPNERAFFCTQLEESGVRYFSFSPPHDDELNKKIPVLPWGGCFSVLHNCNKARKKSAPTPSWLIPVPDLCLRARGGTTLLSLPPSNSVAPPDDKCAAGAGAWQCRLGSSVCFCDARMLDIPIETVKNRWPLGMDTMKQDSGFGTIAGAVREVTATVINGIFYFHGREWASDRSIINEQGGIMAVY